MVAGLRIILAMLLISLTPAGTASAQLNPHPQTGEVRVALVVGNSDYSRTDLQNLPNAANDSAAIDKVLAKAGFLTLRRDNLDRASFVEALGEFEALASQADVALFYYAGHAFEIGNTNLLLPVDFTAQSTVDARDKAVLAQLVEQRMSGAKKLRMLFLDACRENEEVLAKFISEVSARRGGEHISSGLAIPDPTFDTQYFFATKAGSTASDGLGANSPFTEGVLSQIESQGLELDLFFRRVRDYVLRKTDKKQRPFEYGSRSATADFFFFPAPPDLCPAETDARLWAEAEASGTPEALARYLQTCEQGTNRQLALSRMVNAVRDARSAVQTPSVAETVDEEPARDSRIAELAAASVTGDNALAVACSRHGHVLDELRIAARNDEELDLVRNCGPLVAGLDARQQRIAALTGSQDQADRALAMAALTREDRAALSGPAVAAFRQALRESDARVSAFLAAGDGDDLVAAYRELTAYELDARAPREPALKTKIDVARAEIERRQLAEEQRNAARRQAEEALRSAEAERNGRSLDGALAICGEWAASAPPFSRPGERVALQRLKERQPSVDVLIAAHDAIAPHVYVGIFDDLADRPKGNRIDDGIPKAATACAEIVRAAVFSELLRTSVLPDDGNASIHYMLRARLLALSRKHGGLAHFLADAEHAAIESAELEAEGRWETIRAAADFDPLNYVPRLTQVEPGSASLRLANEDLGRCVLLMLPLPKFADVDADAAARRCAEDAQFWMRFALVEKSDPGRADSTVTITFRAPNRDRVARAFARASGGANDREARDAVMLVMIAGDRLFDGDSARSAQPVFYRAFCEHANQTMLRGRLDHYPFPGATNSNGAYSPGDAVELGPSASDKTFCSALKAGGNREYVRIGDLALALSSLVEILRKFDADNALDRQAQWLEQNVNTLLAGPLVVDPETLAAATNGDGRAEASDEPPLPLESLAVDRIRDLQRALTRLGLYTSAIDGKVGAGTRHAIETWFDREGRTFYGTLSEADIARIVASR